MNYYILRPSADPKNIGVKNGGPQARIRRDDFVDKENYDRFLGDFLSNDPTIFWQNIGKFPLRSIELEIVALEPHAKFTDFLSYHRNVFHGGNFLISSRVVSMLKKYSLPEYRLYAARVKGHTGEVVNYNLLYCPPLPFEKIDFDNSVFFEGGKVIGKKYLKIRSRDELIQLKNTRLIEVEKIKLNLPEQFDYFMTKATFPIIFISERFKKEIEALQLSGVAIAKAEDPAVEFS